MRKISFYFLALASFGMIFTSCEDKEEENLSSDEQKNLIEEVAIELAKDVPAQDFAALKDFYDKLSVAVEALDWTLVEDSMKASYENSFIYAGESSRYDTAHYHYENWQWNDSLQDFEIISGEADEIYRANYTIYDVALTLSNFTGHYTAQSNMTWKYEEANDLEFIMYEQDSTPCILKLTKEGKEVSMRLPQGDNGEGYYDYDDSMYVENINVMRYTISIPEKISLVLTNGAQEVISVIVKPSLKNLDKDGYFDFGKSRLVSTVELKLINGYKLTTEGEYTANDKLSLSSSISNSKGELVSYTVSADPKGIPSILLNEDLPSYDFEGLLEDPDANFKNLYVSLSVLEKLQFIGRITGAKEFYAAYTNLNDVKDEASFKKSVDDFNKVIDLGLYYNGSSKKQASMELEASYSKYVYEGREHERWQLIPVMVFADGSRVSCEEYFTADNFSRAINAFAQLAVQYQTLFDEQEASQD